MRLKALLYVKNEWNPNMLTQNLQKEFAIYFVEEDRSGNRAGEIRKVLAENSLPLGEVLVIAATDETIRAARSVGLAVAAYDNPLFPQQTYEGVQMVIEGFEEVDAVFLERVFNRCHGIPWEIARTRRCVIREFTMEDMNALMDLYDQPGITYRFDEEGRRIAGFVEPLYPEEQEREYQEAYISNMYGYYGYGMWMVLDKETGNMIGRAGLEHREYESGVELEIGYLIHPKWQNRGIATEVCSAIIDYARKNLDFSRLNALTDADNAASIALLQKLGFTYLENTDVTGTGLRRYIYIFSS